VSDLSAADLPTRPGENAPQPAALTPEVIEKVVEVLWSPAPVETVEWLDAKAEADAYLCAVREVVAEPPPPELPLATVNQDEAGPA
jgi:hypothetical protein